MPGPTFLELARSIDNELKGNFRYPSKVVVAAGVTLLNGAFDAVIQSDATLGAQNLQLPDATKNKGMPFFIKKVDASANGVVVSCAVGGQLIDGAASFTLGTLNDFIIVISNGVGYSIYSKLITPLGPGASVYTVKKIYKTDGVHTLNPVDGTLISFTVAADGECFFSAAGVFEGSSGLIDTDLAIYVDGVLLCHSTYFAINGSGGDRTGPVTQEPNGSIFLTAGLHTVQLVAGQVNIALAASVGDPLTLTAVFPGSVVTGTTLSPEAARVRTSAPVTINPVQTISFGTVDASQGNLFNIATPTKMIAQLGGWYIFEAQLLTDVGIDGSFRSLKLLKNGVTIVAFDQRDDFVHNATQRGLRAQSGPILLVAGDFIEVIAETDATDSGNVAIAAADYSIVFSGARLIPGSTNADVSARVSISAASVTIPNNTLTKLGFDLVDYDTSGFFALISNTKLIIPVDGKYDISISSILWSPNAVGGRLVQILKNGVATTSINEQAAVTGGGLTDQETHTRGIKCVAGDYFEVSVQQNSGGNLDILTDSGLGNLPAFTAKKVN
jgi:hypothetical protein